MSQYDRAFSAKVLAHAEDLCQEFQTTFVHKLADKVQEDHPWLSHSQIVDAIGRFIRVDGDGSQDKAERWFEFSARDIGSAFEDQFEDEDEDDDWDDDDWDDDDNSDAHVAHVDEVEREGMFDEEQAKFDAYTRHTYDANYTREMLIAYIAEARRESERQSRFFWRTIRWHDNGLEERVRFCQFDDYVEGSKEDEGTFFYGESPDVAIVGYGNDEWVIVGLS